MTTGVDNSAPTKEEISNYRQAGCAPRNCMKCVHKVSVPWFWCDIVGRQVRGDYVCDQWRGLVDGTLGLG
jgi:hypothetical protein